MFTWEVEFSYANLVITLTGHGLLHVRVKGTKFIYINILFALIFIELVL